MPLHPKIESDVVQSEIEGGVWLTARNLVGKLREEPYLPIGNSLRVKTQEHEYFIKKVSEREFRIQGHPKCSAETPVNIHGSTWGGSLLKIGFIGRGMYLEFSTNGYDLILTDLIEEIKEV